MTMQNWAASLVSGQQQTNLGLATLNFDFSLVKLEVPKEFGPIGKQLTRFRRQAAERGIPHVTAQKLRALFQHTLPATPHLIKAYGTRCSEIASAKEDKPETRQGYGIFAEHAGVDATSIWAAATSGAEAVAVHLLACMLARFWSGTEATAIWEELVERRKIELGMVETTDPNYLSSCMAAQITLSREQLREWDASARAWIQTADDAMKTQHKQFMLILENVKLPVSSKTTVLESVLQAWVSAMPAVELLIQGVPQSIQDGSILLGLSSWHIYPDILALGTAPTSVNQKDPLVSEGGVLTIGLQMNREQGGVFWSLPLNYLRYYGGPILAERCLDALGSHITPLQLHQVAAGCLSGSWGLKADELAVTLAELWDCVAPHARKFVDPGTSHWLRTFAQSLEPLLSGTAQEQRSCKQLVRFGQKQRPNFLTPKGPDHEVPRLFGLTQLITVFSQLSDPEKRVEALREYASMLSVPDHCTLVIRYSHDDGMSSGYEYATAVPLTRKTCKHSHDDILSPAAGHARWVTTLYYANDEYSFDSTRSLHFEQLGESTFAVEEESIACDSHAFSWNEPPYLFTSSAPESFSNVDAEAWLESEQRFRRKMDFKWLAGDPTMCALFVSCSSEDYEYLQESVDSRQELPIHSFRKAIKSGFADPIRILSHLSKFLEKKTYSSLLKSLRALATIANIYKMLPDATISLGATSQPLYEALWAEEPQIQAEQGTVMQNTTRKFSALRMDWARTFSCIVFLESGSLNIPPSCFDNVMALSVGNSLYIAAPLLCDPSEDPISFEIRRIRGNVGKPGLAMLIPPLDPRIRRPKDEDWHLVTHADFDGQASDSFHQTSLHLSFTGCMFPIDTRSYGNRDTEIYFLESVVSVHDKGQWVADLDVLSDLRSPKIIRQSAVCCHEPSSEPLVIQNSDFTMVDTWSEIIESPDKAAIIRSSGNWIGRLATTALSVQMGRDTIIGLDKFCWKCLKAMWVNHKGQVRTSQGKDDVMNNWKAGNTSQYQAADFQEMAGSSSNEAFAELLAMEEALELMGPRKGQVQLRVMEEALEVVERRQERRKGQVKLRAVEEALELKKRREAIEEETRVLNEMRDTFIIY